MVYYQVNNKTLYNPYLAYYESYRSGQHIKFNCFDAEYSKLDWTQEPAETMDELMTQHAIYLRNRYQRIVLPWSGGTDCHTIYEIFVQNNLHIDEILIFTDGISTVDEHAKWMTDNHPDPTTKISVFKTPDVNFVKTIAEEVSHGDTAYDEDWIFDNKGAIVKLSQVGSIPFWNIHCRRTYGDESYALVVGWEKPFLYYQYPYWYSKQSDILLAPTLGHENLECFYLAPMINLKQSHVAKNFLKKLKKKSLTEIDRLQAHTPLGARPYRHDTDYQINARMTGRHSELIPGMSYRQKVNNVNGYRSLIVDPRSHEFKNGEKFLLDAVDAQDKTAEMFLNGIRNIVSDRGFFEFLNENFLVEPGKILHLRPIWSTAYNLGS